MFLRCLVEIHATKVRKTYHTESIMHLDVHGGAYYYIEHNMFKSSVEKTTLMQIQTGDRLVAIHDRTACTACVHYKNYTMFFEKDTAWVLPTFRCIKIETH